MSDSRALTHMDAEILRIVRFHGPGAAEHLFRNYLASGGSKDAFVAALIARLCMHEARVALSASADQSAS